MSQTTSATGLLAGIASLAIDGTSFDVVSDLEYNVPGLKLETLKGQSRVEGPSGMPEEGFISATLRVNPGIGITPYRGRRNISATLVCANGVVVTMTNGWTTEFDGSKTQEGTWSIKMESNDVTEDTV